MPFQEGEEWMQTHTERRLCEDTGRRRPSTSRREEPLNITNPAHTLILDLWSRSVRRLISVVCLSCPVRGTLLQQSWQTQSDTFIHFPDCKAPAWLEATSLGQENAGSDTHGGLLVNVEAPLHDAGLCPWLKEEMQRTGRWRQVIST